MDMTQAKMFVRSLNNSSAKILMAFILARTALDAQELREWTGMKRQTIYDALDDLKALGKVEPQTLSHGRRVWLPSGDILPGFEQMSPKWTPALPDVQKTDTTTLLVVGGESINLIDSELTTTIPQVSEKGTSENLLLPSLKDILFHTDKLFDGSQVSSASIEDREPRYALAWCAYAYRERAKLTGPAGLVRKRLMDDQVPPEWAQQQWREVLPCDFLEALELVEYTCQICGTKFKRMADLEAHEATHPKVYACSGCEQSFTREEDLDAHYDKEHRPKHIQPDDSVTVSIDGRMTAEQAWQSTLGQLQMEMPRASFDSWVRDTRAVRYDGNVLTIGTRNAYARDWLESRLASTVSRLLVGIMNASVVVEFVVAEEVSA